MHTPLPLHSGALSQAPFGKLFVADVGHATAAGKKADRKVVATKSLPHTPVLTAKYKSTHFADKLCPRSLAYIYINLSFYRKYPAQCGKKKAIVPQECTSSELTIFEHSAEA